MGRITKEVSPRLPLKATLTLALSLREREFWIRSVICVVAVFACERTA
jgi:hypothetical protein